MTWHLGETFGVVSSGGAGLMGEKVRGDLGVFLGVLSLVRFLSSKAEDWRLGKAVGTGTGANATLGFSARATASLSSSVMVSGMVTDVEMEQEWWVLEAGEGTTWPDVVSSNGQQIIFNTKR